MVGISTGKLGGGSVSDGMRWNRIEWGQGSVYGYWDQGKSDRVMGATSSWKVKEQDGIERVHEYCPGFNVMAS